MFLQHFALTEDPFGVTPDPRYLYFGREHREAMASLYHGIVNSRGFTVLIAPPGMGKTTLLHYLRERIQEWADTAFLFCPFEDKHELLQAVMAAVSLEADGNFFHNWRRFQAYLEERQLMGRKVVLVFDEAQNLTYSMLEQIRMFSNLETPQSKLAQIVLAGQPALAQKLNAPEMEQFGQRIGVFSRIPPLNETEVEAYLQHRLNVAGCTGELFTPEAIALIAHYSRGVPRNVNTLCYNAMALGWVLSRRQIDKELVEQSVRDLNLAGMDRNGAAHRASVQSQAGPVVPARPAAGPEEAFPPKNPNLPARLVEILWNLGDLLEELQNLSKKAPGCLDSSPPESVLEEDLVPARNGAQGNGSEKKQLQAQPAGVNWRGLSQPRLEEKPEKGDQAQEQSTVESEVKTSCVLEENSVETL